MIRIERWRVMAMMLDAAGERALRRYAERRAAIRRVARVCFAFMPLIDCRYC